MKFATFEVSEIFGITNTARYPYKWRVGYDQRDMFAVEHDEMLDWLDTSGIPHTLAGSAIYFKTKEDVTFFLLRWS